MLKSTLCVYKLSSIINALIIKCMANPHLKDASSNLNTLKSKTIIIVFLETSSSISLLFFTMQTT